MKFKGWLFGCEFHGTLDEVLPRIRGLINWPAVKRIEVRVIGFEADDIFEGYIEPELEEEG